MSTVSRRPRVKSITSAALQAVAMHCVEAVGSMVRNTIRSIETANLDSLTKSAMTSPLSIDSAVLPVSVVTAGLPAVRAQVANELAKYGLPALETAKLGTLLTLRAAPFVCEPASLQAPLQAVANAKTEAAVLQAASGLFETATTGHLQMMTDALATACKRASVESGFPTVDTMVGIEGDIRIIASDDRGRALVTEIHSGRKHEPSLETEVVGVTDGSCVGILDRFDRALEEQGVRGIAPERKWTGGVCELGAAKELLKKLQFSSKGKQDAAQRTRKLNARAKKRISVIV